MQYTVIIERGESNYGAYVPSLPGCVSVGHTIEEIKRNIQESIEFHLEGMALEGLEIPPADPDAQYIVEKLQPTD